MEMVISWLRLRRARGCRDAVGSEERVDSREAVEKGGSAEAVFGWPEAFEGDGESEGEEPQRSETGTSSVGGATRSTGRKRTEGAEEGGSEEIGGGWRRGVEAEVGARWPCKGVWQTLQSVRLSAFLYPHRGHWIMCITPMPVCLEKRRFGGVVARGRREGQERLVFWGVSVRRRQGEVGSIDREGVGGTTLPPREIEGLSG